MFSLKKMSICASFALLALSACKKDKPYNVPTTYSFDNVSFTESVNTVDMLDSLKVYMTKSQAVGASALDAQHLRDLFANANSPFGRADLDAATYSLRNQTESNARLTLDALIDSLASISTHTANNSPSNGVAGVASSNDASKHYLLNANGAELLQIIEKGIMGATLYYQATNVLLGDGMSVDNKVVIAGTGTAMEHNWDKAFGFLTVPVDFPINNTGIRFWGKYSNSRDSKIGVNSTLMNGFLAGRAAISNDDIETRNVKILTVRRQWELVSAASAIHYLNEAKAQFTVDMAIKHHALSEAYAFIWALKFNGNAVLTPAQVDTLLETLGGSSNPLNANFYNTTAANIQNTIDGLATYYASLQAVKDTL